jgi:hypothetical protein
MWDDIRIQQLGDNIRQDLDLLKGFEDEIRYETNPRIIAKYRKDIERQRDSLALNQKEYDEIIKNAQDVIVSNPVPEKELQDTLNAVQMILSEIRQSKAGQYSPQLVSEVEKVSGIINDPKLDSNHKLKYSIPIIPLILSYEGDVELKGGLDLKKAWQGLKSWLQGKK